MPEIITFDLNINTSSIEDRHVDLTSTVDLNVNTVEAEDRHVITLKTFDPVER